MLTHLRLRPILFTSCSRFRFWCSIDFFTSSLVANSRRSCLHSFSSICLRVLQFSLQSILSVRKQQLKYGTSEQLRMFIVWCVNFMCTYRDNLSSASLRCFRSLFNWDSIDCFCRRSSASFRSVCCKLCRSDWRALDNSWSLFQS